MSSTAPAPDRMSTAQLRELAEAPDLTKGERRELQRAIRFQKRVETWEERRANPAPRKLHRAIVTLLMMGACIWLLVLLLHGPPTA